MFCEVAATTIRVPSGDIAKESIEELGGGTTDNRSEETAGECERRSVKVATPAIASSALIAAIHCHGIRNMAPRAGIGGTGVGMWGGAASGGPISNEGTEPP